MTSSRPPAPVDPTAGTPVTDAHIGCRVICVGCGRVGEIDDVTPGGSVIVRHAATVWCVVPAALVGFIEAWNTVSS